MPYLTAQDMIDRYGESFLAEITAQGAAPGVVDMGDETPADTGPGNPQLPQVNAPQATFSRDTLKGF